MSRKKRVDSVLVANRGEIAVRLIRTLKSLGLRTVAAHSEADATSLPVQLADEAALLGPPPATDSYLRIDRILEAAKKHDVSAVHPGYGFLSERDDFAAAVEDAGLVFLGPTAQQIAVLGDKLQARKLMEKAGIGPVPGTEKPLRDVSEALRVAGKIGYPLILKAAAGGGGKGIRIVREKKELESSYRLAASEAESSFGSPLLFAESYLEKARHVEIQVLGDGAGGARIFWERDCSIQRRLQKLVEESPSPAVSPEVRERLFHAALAVVQKVRYRGPGTLEFLLARGETLHFLEMNTRIQVEHPVTEMVSGIDLVAEQIRIAEGARLGGKSLDAVVVDARGAAIELRINAENPLEDFRPSVGSITQLHLPHGPGIRVDTAAVAGCEVSPYYDPLVAKLIAWGEDRNAALSRLGTALGEFVVGGVYTTLPVGRSLLDDPSFQRGDYHCQYLAEKLEDRRFLRAQPEDRDLPALAASLALLHHQARRQSTREVLSSEPISSWRRPTQGGCWELEGS